MRGWTSTASTSGTRAAISRPLGPRCSRRLRASMASAAARTQNRWRPRWRGSTTHSAWPASSIRAQMRWLPMQRRQSTRCSQRRQRADGIELTVKSARKALTGHATIEPGLTSAEAARRFAVYGPNEPAPVRRLSAVVQLFHLFANPLVIILLAASAIAGSLGQHVDALIIVTMVVLGVTINFWQSYRSQQAAERLRLSVIPTARVLRDGAWLETPVRNVVAGDVFRLSAGDLVP